jgi:hypothetical protein
MFSFLCGRIKNYQASDSCSPLSNWCSGMNLAQKHKLLTFFVHFTLLLKTNMTNFLVFKSHALRLVGVDDFCTNTRIT